MYRKDGFERVGDFSELWPAFCRAAARFGAYAPSELNHGIGPDELLLELQRASAAASDRAAAEGGDACVAGFDVHIQGQSVSVTFGGGRSAVSISPYMGGLWSFVAGSRSAESLDSCMDSVMERWEAAGFPLPR